MIRFPDERDSAPAACGRFYTFRARTRSGRAYRAVACEDCYPDELDAYGDMGAGPDCGLQIAEPSTLALVCDACGAEGK